MSAICFGFLKACMVYIVYFSILWCTASEYKASFNNKPNSVNGYILKLFVSLSGLGNAIYSAIKNLSFHIVCRTGLRIPTILRVLCAVLDMGLFTLFLFIISGLFNLSNDLLVMLAGGWDLDLLSWGELSIGNLSSYMSLIVAILNGNILMCILGFFIMTAVKFFYYAVVFGFLNNRMFPTCLVDKIGATKEAADNQLAVLTATMMDEKLKTAAYNGSANAAYTILDSLSTCLYRFAGLKGVVQIALIVIVYTLIDALGVAIGIVKVDAGEFVWSILNLSDVFSIIVDMLISLGIIKLGQILVVENIVKSKPEEERAKVYAKAQMYAEQAEQKVEERKMQAMASDIVCAVNLAEDEEEADIIFKAEMDQWQSTHKHTSKSKAQGSNKYSGEPTEEWINAHSIEYQREKMRREREKKNK